MLSPLSARAKQSERKLQANAELEAKWKIIPDIIQRTENNVVVEQFRRGRFIGKGGFARVYEVTSTTSGIVYACKIIPKVSLKRTKARQKLIQEIKIHRSLDHDNIVKFVNFLEDKEFVYILLELCDNTSMLRLIRKRKKISEAEARYYLFQLVSGLAYLKQNRVIHRDLKLGNLFLAGNMRIKIGDFGLAAKLTHDEERKRTICGTPNYIAPEILKGSAEGHSYEVDVWSLGVVMYTLVVGKPPFETKDLKTTYKRIAANTYSFPESRRDISDELKGLIRSMLNPVPEKRPRIEALLTYDFLRQCIPAYVPCASMERSPQPRCSELSSLLSPTHYWTEDPPSTTALLNTVMQETDSSISSVNATPTRLLLLSSTEKTPSDCPVNLEMEKIHKSITGQSNASETNLPLGFRIPATEVQMCELPPVVPALPTAPDSTLHLSPSRGSKTTNLRSPMNKHPTTTIMVAPSLTSPSIGTAQRGDPLRLSRDTVLDRIHQTLESALLKESALSTAHNGSQVVTGKKGLKGHLLVARWIDFTSRYGLVYQLSNRCTGIYFNDDTKIIYNPKTSGVVYAEPNIHASGLCDLNSDKVRHFHFSQAPEELHKKMELLVYFRCYYSSKQYSREDMRKTMEATGDPSSSVREPLVYVHKWVRTKHAIVFRLSDENLQANFLDHNKIYLYEGGEKMIYLNSDNKITLLQTEAAVSDSHHASRLRYIKDILVRLIDSTCIPRDVNASKAGDPLYQKNRSGKVESVSAISNQENLISRPDKAASKDKRGQRKALGQNTQRNLGALGIRSVAV